MDTSFDGFPMGAFHQLPIPPSFFSHLLPQIDTLAELKLTLFCFYALSQQGTHTPYLKKQHFLVDEALCASLVTPEYPTPEKALDQALARMIGRGTLLAVPISTATATETLYFVNTPKGRKAVEQITMGNWRVLSDTLDIEILPERPTVFSLYEQNIGALTAHIAQELKDAQTEYGAEWIEDAIKIACESNKRNWRYVRGILNRWKQEGRTHDNTTQGLSIQDTKRYLSGKYADFIDS